MKNLSAIILIVFLFLSSAPAQELQMQARHYSGNIVNSEKTTGTLKILVALVEFQEDEDANTVGNGKFSSIYEGDEYTDILDPLPHDMAYFDAHLQFAENYYQKISDGNLDVQYTILPNIITVSQTMKGYSPAVNSDDYSIMATLVDEAWKNADELHSNVSFSDYDLFIIIHAGVSRSVSLPGSIGNERDLPSIYMDLTALRNYYGNDYLGVPVSGGNYITNTVLMPQTENREIESFGERFLFEISTNGLLVSSIASYLGLPDLFDTETGKSAIGKFGLMDGQAIYSYFGVIPPAMSAWERIRLGWAEALEVPVKDTTRMDITIATRLMKEQYKAADIIKVPINDKEYYLIENRQRDANNDGCILTIWEDGVYRTKTYSQDTTSFYPWDVDTLSGVIVDIDEFDWALPGNGIVIWHIDEGIINEKIETNEINNDAENRGIDVEEADGIQDIGVEYYTLLGDVVVGEGDYYDFWYSSNEADLYENKFGGSTRPNTNSNGGAKSLITFSNFSDSANVMTFSVEYGDSSVVPYITGNINAEGSVSQIIPFTYGTGKDIFYVVANDALYHFRDGVTVKHADNFSEFEATWFDKGIELKVVGLTQTSLNAYQTNLSGSSDIFASVPLPEGATTDPVIVIRDEKAKILVGTASGTIYEYDFDGVLNGSSAYSNKYETDEQSPVKRIVTSGTTFYSLQDASAPAGTNGGNTGFKIYSNGNLFYHGANASMVNDIAVTKLANGSDALVAFILPNQLTQNIYGFKIIENGSLYNTILFESDNQISTFSIADLKNESENYIVFADGNTVSAYTLSGAVAKHFPVKEPMQIGFTGTVLAADFEGDAKAELVATTKDGRIFAFDGGTGNLVNGFPLDLGDEFISTPVFCTTNDKLVVSGVTKDNHLSSWFISPVSGTVQWNGTRSNGNNAGFVPAASGTNVSDEFMPEMNAYNWPNPVYGGETFIRYYVSEDADVEIKIFDLAGDYVAELTDNAIGKMENETRWQLDNIQSGVYIARIEATGVSGKNEFAIIKIAVVK